jgi:lysophospholipase L1-like esterase
MRSLLFLFVLWFQSLHLTEAQDESILVLGDSWASLSRDLLGGVCGLGGNAVETRVIRNEGISGTTAAQWAENADATKPFNTDDFDYVWLSIGGNDFLYSNCNTALRAEISASILTVISQIVEATTNENLKILVLGYSIPSQDVCGGGTTPDLFESQTLFLQLAIQTSVYADYVEVIDISDVFVTPESTPFSDDQWYADAVHMNEDGYAKLFSLEPIQEFFGCIESASTSVPTSSPTVMESSPTIAGPTVTSPTTTESSSPPSSSPIVAVPTFSIAPTIAPEPTQSISPSIAPSVESDSPTLNTLVQKAKTLEATDIALIAVALFGLIMLAFGVCGSFCGSRKQNENNDHGLGVVEEGDEEEEEKKADSEEEA